MFTRALAEGGGLVGASVGSVQFGLEPEGRHMIGVLGEDFFNQFLGFFPVAAVEGHSGQFGVGGGSCVSRGEGSGCFFEFSLGLAGSGETDGGGGRLGSLV
ncbi:MAG: hypothetical protein M5R36_27010 [Deltaproteobacteria bacterium]|nr:hypothetical protein [Deltaproteobacteria bacterium]